MLSPARKLAFRVLRRVAAQGSRASDLLASLQAEKLSERDRRLAYELVLGVLRWQRLLDHLIAHYSGRAPERLDEPIRIALRLGLYQLRFLERIPAYAAVSEAVALVKQYGPAWGAGLVNAVLRRAASAPDDRPWRKIADPIERASIEWSHPAWLVRKWVKDFGMEEALALLRANNQAPTITIRLNPLAAPDDEIMRALAHQEIEIEPSPYVPGAYRVRSGSLSPRVDAWQRGWIYVQEEASQLIAHIVAPEPGMRILEICAAPGSKTTHLAALMANRGMIVAGDRHFGRLRQLQLLAERLHVRIAHPVVFEGKDPLPLLPTERFDRVLLDAPCSGTGTLRRHPEIKWRLTQEEVHRMAEQQKALLREAARWVAPGGWLIYSTCSLEQEENEEIVGAFLASQPEFRLVVPSVAEVFRTEGGYIRTFPHRHGMDGFFAAVLERIPTAAEGP
ncbi:MAG: 16S rRNA (cytosine(967)-C(5))-methyltransferase RsmB [Blastocatellia bacterium]|nr:16S rRNA (cytosine(967)-C(5))-methyltransferase RsmB [Blastocatellia bacterium]MCX7753048.1 16S rRNA (cytosine(967)-C(5))-methyltransferase RsmB [Blastocatellia bacterium]MDW8168571.1 16S rRNA (cytosine(967)-C(5))-methyltransferase RsmB [Acidobacteriota bacterium]MDW8257266.1 16S rRNA (cytosine(967)-C(5))-methyltransferase RsmB [Acidobacteriota bacterium]